MDTNATDTKFRRLSGPMAQMGAILLAMPVILGSLWAVEIHHYLGLLIFEEQFLVVMLGFALLSVFVWVKPRRGGTAEHVGWYDWILSAAAVATCLYVVVNYGDIIYDLSTLSLERLGFGAIALLLVFEATRRLIGWTLILIAVFFILYARFGDMLPGIFAVPPTRWERITVYIFLDTNGLFGLPIGVAATTIVTFVLFGGILKLVGGDRFITDLALIAMGRYRGGPAKVSIIASTLFGTVSGSAVSNVAVVGPISIPMMERAGYPKHQAAAVEAVSSTGGQIMPPVMGITAFLMADFLGIPYSDVVLAALIPAVLYYFAVFVQVDLEAARRGLKGLPREQIPRLRPTLSQGYAFIVPLAVLIYTVMFAHWTPGRAGLAAAGCALAIGLLRSGTRPGLPALWRVLVTTGRSMMDILILTAVAGVVIGALQVSGVSFSLSSMLLSLAGDNVLLILLMTGIVCVVLGMALPTAVIYTMLAVLVAPALTQLGVDRLAAHLFIFYMGMLSMITPPVCFATFTAASIAGSNFWRTAFSGMRFGIVAYILPFVFPFSLGLIMQGDPLNVILALLTAIVGVIGLGIGLTGYLFGTLNPLQRLLFFVAGIAIMPSPTASDTALILNIAGIGAGALSVAYAWIVARRRPAAIVPAAAEQDLRNQ
ncbi:MAG: TRAP transporter fused permease subunit [Azospirillaceae bacterium]